MAGSLTYNPEKTIIVAIVAQLCEYAKAIEAYTWNRQILSLT